MRTSSTRQSGHQYESAVRVERTRRTSTCQSLQPTTTAIRSLFAAHRLMTICRSLARPASRPFNCRPSARLGRDRPQHKSSRPNCSMHRHLSPRRCAATGYVASTVSRPSTDDAVDRFPFSFQYSFPYRSPLNEYRALT